MDLMIDSFRGAESATEMVNFARTGKLFRKLSRLEIQRNTTLGSNAPKISPETKKFPERAFAHTGRFCTSAIRYRCSTSVNSNNAIDDLNRNSRKIHI